MIAGFTSVGLFNITFPPKSVLPQTFPKLSVVAPTSLTDSPASKVPTLVLSTEGSTLTALSPLKTALTTCPAP